MCILFSLQGIHYIYAGMLLDPPSVNTRHSTDNLTARLTQFMRNLLFLVKWAQKMNVRMHAQPRGHLLIGGWFLLPVDLAFLDTKRLVGY
jgi:hypothetical protein